MKKEKTVRTYQRRTKSGKTITVKQHTAKYDAAEQAKDIVKKAGAGAELEKLRVTKPTRDPYEDFDFTKEEFAEWYEGTGSKADRKVEKALRKMLGKKAYDELNDAAAGHYKAGGAHKFFASEVQEGRSPASQVATAKPKESKSINTAMESPFGQVKRLSGKTAVEAKKTLVNEGYEVVKDGGHTYLRKGKDMYEYIPSGVAKGGAQLVELSPPRRNEVLGKIGDKSKGSKSSKETSVATPKAEPKTKGELPIFNSKRAANKWLKDNGFTVEYGEWVKKGGYTIGRIKEKNGKFILPKEANLSDKEIKQRIREEEKFGEFLDKGKGSRYASESIEDWKKRKTAKEKSSKEPKSKAPIKKPKSDATSGATAVKYNGKTYMVTTNGSVETVTGRKVGKALSSKILSEKVKPRKKKKNTPEQDAALDATLAEIRERNRQPYQFSR